MLFSQLISSVTWRRVLFGSGIGVVFGTVLCGFVALTGMLQIVPSEMPAAKVLVEALPSICVQLTPWLLLWLVVLPALLRPRLLQPWLGLALYVAAAVVLVPRAIDIPELETSQLVAIGLLALVTGLPIARAGDSWLVASFFGAVYLVTSTIVGLPFGGSGGYGVWQSRAVGDVVLTGGRLGPVFGVFGMLGMLWLAGSLLQHQSLLFADAKRIARSRRQALVDFGLGLLLAAAAVALMFVAALAARQVRIGAMELSVAPLLASLSRQLPRAIASAFLWCYVYTGAIAATTRRPLLAAMAVALGAAAWNGWGAGATFFTAASAGALVLAQTWAYASTGRLWMPVAISFGWMLCEGPIFGFSSGGFPPQSPWIQQEILQYTAWNGGVYGPDGAVFGIAAKLLIVAALVYLGRHQLRQRTGVQ